jgi:cytochrome P450
VFAPVILAAFLRSMCSAEYSDEDMAQISDDLRTLLAAGGSFGFAPTQIGVGPRRAVPAMRRAVGVSARMLDDRLASGVNHDDLLDKILKFTGRNGRPLVRAELIYLLVLLLLGGYDTLVASMSWMFGLLCLNPEPAQRLYAEIDGLNGKVPTFDDLKLLPWTKACFDEAQRLQGGPLHKTVAITDVEIDGFSFPKGTVFGLGWASMHRDPRWWPDPERYDPTRFTDSAVIAARPKTAFVPFGVGKLACPGQAMAYANAQLLSAVILQRFRFTVPAGWRPEPFFAGSTPVKDGVPVTITRTG